MPIKGFTLSHTETVIITRRKALITSVYLLKPEAQGLHLFHCFDCGTIVMQYDGEVAKVIPGYNKSELPIVVQCPNSKCKHKYHFISMVEETD